MSCCIRGGSWFKNCGAAGNTKVEHTWYEGIQACNTRRQSKIALQLNAAPENSHASADNADKVINPKAFIMAEMMFASAPANMSTRIPDVTGVMTSVNTSSTASTRIDFFVDVVVLFIQIMYVLH